MTTATQEQVLSPPDYTVNQIAKKISATPIIVRKAIANGSLKSYKISERNTRITQEALDEFRNNGGAA